MMPPCLACHGVAPKMYLQKSSTFWTHEGPQAGGNEGLEETAKEEVERKALVGGLEKLGK